MSDRTLFFDSIKTPFGIFRIAASEKGLVQIHFPHRQISAFKHQKMPQRVRKVLELSKRFLRSFFAGRSYRANTVPIDWRFFSSFDRRVLATLIKTSGGTISYGELARQSGVPLAVRAVGNALRRNPVPILIPCHRVIRKDQSLGGYAGGIRWKQILLNLDQKVRV